MPELIITNLAPQLGQWKVETNYPFTSQTDDRSVRYYCNETLQTIYWVTGLTSLLDKTFYQTLQMVV